MVQHDGVLPVSTALLGNLRPDLIQLGPVDLGRFAVKVPGPCHVCCAEVVHAIGLVTLDVKRRYCPSHLRHHPRKVREIFRESFQDVDRVLAGGVVQPELVNLLELYHKLDVASVADSQRLPDRSGDSEVHVRIPILLMSC